MFNNPGPSKPMPHHDVVPEPAEGCIRAGDRIRLVERNHDPFPYPMVGARGDVGVVIRSDWTGKWHNRSEAQPRWSLTIMWETGPNAGYLGLLSSPPDVVEGVPREV